MRVAALTCTMLVGCYQATEFATCALACDPDNASGDCPEGLTCIGGRCSDGNVCPPPDGECLGTGLLTNLCPPVPGLPGPLIFDGGLISTDACESIAGGVLGEVPGTTPRPFCALHAPSMRVVGSAGLRAVGSLPLVLVSDSTIEIDGTIDVGSSSAMGAGAGANAGCDGVAPNGGTQGQGGGTSGGGGGGGGSFQGGGGGGGTGEKSGVFAAGGVASVGSGLTFRGGCRGGAGGNDATAGGSGAGGDGGGVIYLVARDSITLTGAAAILAGGAGGTNGTQDAGGGGGGGAGGLIVFDVPSIQSIDGQPFICANGGGGGGGAESNMNGKAGANGCTGSLILAAGGGEGGVAGDVDGDGGSGGAMLAGSMGSDSVDGGGGGGGGTGYLVVYNAENAEHLGFNVSPPMTVLVP